MHTMMMNGNREMHAHAHDDDDDHNDDDDDDDDDTIFRNNQILDDAQVNAESLNMR